MGRIKLYGAKLALHVSDSQKSNLTEYWAFQPKVHSVHLYFISNQWSIDGQNVPVHNIKPQKRPLLLEANAMYCLLANKITLLELPKHSEISSPQTLTFQDFISFDHTFKTQSPLQQDRLFQH